MSREELKQQVFLNFKPKAYSIVYSKVEKFLKDHGFNQSEIQDFLNLIKSERFEEKQNFNKAIIILKIFSMLVRASQESFKIYFDAVKLLFSVKNKKFKFNRLSELLADKNFYNVIAAEFDDDQKESVILLYLQVKNLCC